MCKRFEDARAPYLGDLLLAYELFRMEDLLGTPGRNTAFAIGSGTFEDHVVFHTVPGDWQDEELRELIRDVYGGVSTPNAVKQVA